MHSEDQIIHNLMHLWQIC